MPYAFAEQGVARRLGEGMHKPKRGIFFDNQIYDAYTKSVFLL